MSDRDSWPANPNDISPQAPKSSGGGCFKAFLIIGGLGMVCMLLCCGGGVWFVSTLAPKEATNPADVAEIGREIAKIELPAEYVGAKAFTMDSFLMTFQVADFKRTGSESHMLVGRVVMKIGQANNHDKEMKLQTRALGIDDPSLREVKSETREFEIDGKKVPFKFSEAISPESKKEFRVVDGLIVTDNGAKFVKFVIEAADYDEDEIVKIIESIH